MTATFHLSFPVKDLQTSEEFYIKCFNAKVGRRTSQWIDILFFGHQLTLHWQPQQVLNSEDVGIRHFGIILNWTVWEALKNHLEKLGINFKINPQIKYSGTDKEQGKFLLSDPSENLIEIKSYRNFEAIFKQ